MRQKDAVWDIATLTSDSTALPTSTKVPPTSSTSEAATTMMMTMMAEMRRRRTTEGRQTSTR